MNEVLLVAAYVLGLGMLLGYVVSLRVRRVDAANRRALLERQGGAEGHTGDES